MEEKKTEAEAGIKIPEEKIIPEEKKAIVGETSEENLLNKIKSVGKAASDIDELPKGNDMERMMGVENEAGETVYNDAPIVKDEKKAEEIKSAKPEKYLTGKKKGQHKASCKCNSCKAKRGEKIPEIKKAGEAKAEETKKEIPDSEKIDAISHLLNAPISFLAAKMKRNPSKVVISQKQQVFLLKFQPEIKEARSWWWYIPTLITTIISNFFIGNDGTSYAELNKEKVKAEEKK